MFLNFEAIDWIQAADQYVVVRAGTKEYLLRESLQHLAGRLPQEHFARIHRSHLINISRIKEIKRLRKGDAQVLLADGRGLRWSRRYRRALPATLGRPET